MHHMDPWWADVATTSALLLCNAPLQLCVTVSHLPPNTLFFPPRAAARIARDLGAGRARDLI
eukprot:1196246-Prorocentrum_minimum.AAC.2